MYILYLPDTYTFLQPKPIYGPEYNDNARLKVFALEDTPVKYEVKNLETVDLIFIPVLLSQHFFCICFHLKKGEIELIDNSRIKQAFAKRYRGCPEMLRKALIQYLKNKVRQKEWIKKLETTRIIRKEMDWRTLENGVNCGVFTMRHMETYKGKTPWNLGFVNEDRKDVQDSKLRFLRYCYLSKIVLSDYNLIRKQVFDAAKEFEKNSGKVDMLKDLDKKKSVNDWMSSLILKNCKQKCYVLELFLLQ
ncbi:putative Ulp1 protease family catalytic domain, papain-like cysteine peptidase superfamily [Helianthus annuus]|nr:putative Ulp1 protease family catalytic domain, papain-like cysteine peptidase superfamily [Helianthus annuus]